MDVSSLCCFDVRTEQGKQAILLECRALGAPSRLGVVMQLDLAVAVIVFGHIGEARQHELEHAQHHDDDAAGKHKILIY